MTDWTDWPFFEDRHRDFAAQIGDWSAKSVNHHHGSDVDAECRTLVMMLGRAGFLQHTVAHDGGRPDVRTLSIARATLAYHSSLADFTFAMQGLGSGGISLHGSDEQRRTWLDLVGKGEAIAAFALTEPETGSNAAAIATSAVRDGDEWVINGEKTYISNGTIADVATLYARTGSREDGARGISAFVLPMKMDGVEMAQRIDTIAPHPLARIKLDNVRLPASALLGEEGQGFRIAMSTLNMFRVTVGAAALGFARRALDEAIAFTKNRPLGDAPLSDHPVTQAKLAEMALAVDRSALLIARAGWAQDNAPDGDHRRAASMAKLDATEEAQKVIDAAVQLHGGMGVTHGARVEELYREIRALRIYEGASEVQRQVIGKDLTR